jgi:hypothetical protein
MIRTHTDDSTIVMQRDAFTLKTVSASPHNLGHLLIKWVRKPYMSHDSTIKESERSNPLCAINNLVRYHKVPWLDLFLQRTHCGECNDASDTNGAESGDVGTVWNLVRGMLVVEAVSRKKGNRDVVVLEDRNGRRGFAPRCVYIEGCHWFVAVELLQTSSTNDGDMNRSCEAQC